MSMLTKTSAHLPSCRHELVLKYEGHCMNCVANEAFTTTESESDAGGGFVVVTSTKEICLLKQKLVGDYLHFLCDVKSADVMISTIVCAFVEGLGEKLVSRWIGGSRSRHANHAMDDDANRASFLLGLVLKFLEKRQLLHVTKEWIFSIGLTNPTTMAVAQVFLTLISNDGVKHLMERNFNNWRCNAIMCGVIRLLFQKKQFALVLQVIGTTIIGIRGKSLHFECWEKEHDLLRLVEAVKNGKLATSCFHEVFNQLRASGAGMQQVLCETLQVPRETYAYLQLICLITFCLKCSSNVAAVMPGMEDDFAFWRAFLLNGTFLVNMVDLLDLSNHSHDNDDDDDDDSEPCSSLLFVATSNNVKHVALSCMYNVLTTTTTTTKMMGSETLQVMLRALIERRGGDVLVSLISQQTLFFTSTKETRAMYSRVFDILHVFADFTYSNHQQKLTNNAGEGESFIPLLAHELNVFLYPIISPALELILLQVKKPMPGGGDDNNNSEHWKKEEQHNALYGMVRNFSSMLSILSVLVECYEHFDKALTIVELFLTLLLWSGENSLIMQSLERFTGIFAFLNRIYSLHDCFGTCDFVSRANGVVKTLVAYNDNDKTNKFWEQIRASDCLFQMVLNTLQFMCRSTKESWLLAGSIVLRETQTFSVFEQGDMISLRLVELFADVFTQGKLLIAHHQQNAPVVSMCSQIGLRLTRSGWLAKQFHTCLDGKLYGKLCTDVCFALHLLDFNKTPSTTHSHNNNKRFHSSDTVFLLDQLENEIWNHMITNSSQYCNSNQAAVLVALLLEQKHAKPHSYLLLTRAWSLLSQTLLDGEFDLKHNEHDGEMLFVGGISLFCEYFATTCTTAVDSNRLLVENEPFFDCLKRRMARLRDGGENVISLLFQGFGLRREYLRLSLMRVLNWFLGDDCAWKKKNLDQQVMLVFLVVREACNWWGALELVKGLAMSDFFDDVPAATSNKNDYNQSAPIATNSTLLVKFLQYSLLSSGESELLLERFPFRRTILDAVAHYLSLAKENNNNNNSNNAFLTTICSAFMTPILDAYQNDPTHIASITTHDLKFCLFLVENGYLLREESVPNIGRGGGGFMEEVLLTSTSRLSTMLTREELIRVVAKTSHATQRAFYCVNNASMVEQAIHNIHAKPFHLADRMDIVILANAFSFEGPFTTVELLLVLVELLNKYKIHHPRGVILNSIAQVLERDFFNSCDLVENSIVPRILKGASIALFIGENMNELEFKSAALRCLAQLIAKFECKPGMFTMHHTFRNLNCNDHVQMLAFLFLKCARCEKMEDNFQHDINTIIDEVMMALVDDEGEWNERSLAGLATIAVYVSSLKRILFSSWEFDGLKENILSVVSKVKLIHNVKVAVENNPAHVDFSTTRAVEEIVKLLYASQTASSSEYSFIVSHLFWFTKCTNLSLIQVVLNSIVNVLMNEEEEEEEETAVAATTEAHDVQVPFESSDVLLVKHASLSSNKIGSLFDASYSTMDTNWTVAASEQEPMEQCAATPPLLPIGSRVAHWLVEEGKWIESEVLDIVEEARCYLLKNPCLAGKKAIVASVCFIVPLPRENDEMQTYVFKKNEYVYGLMGTNDEPYAFRLGKIVQVIGEDGLQQKNPTHNNKGGVFDYFVTFYEINKSTNALVEASQQLVNWKDVFIPNNGNGQYRGETLGSEIEFNNAIVDVVAARKKKREKLEVERKTRTASHEKSSLWSSEEMECLSEMLDYYSHDWSRVDSLLPGRSRKEMKKKLKSLVNHPHHQPAKRAIHANKPKQKKQAIAVARRRVSTEKPLPILNTTSTSSNVGGASLKEENNRGGDLNKTRSEISQEPLPILNTATTTTSARLKEENNQASDFDADEARREIFEFLAEKNMKRNKLCELATNGKYGPSFAFFNKNKMSNPSVIEAGKVMLRWCREQKKANAIQHQQKHNGAATSSTPHVAEILKYAKSIGLATENDFLHRVGVASLSNCGTRSGHSSGTSFAQMFLQGTNLNHPQVQSAGNQIQEWYKNEKQEAINVANVLTELKRAAARQTKSSII